MIQKYLWVCFICHEFLFSNGNKMNVKLWAIVLALIVVLTSTGVYMSSNAAEDDKVVIASRTNEEGSGLFAKQDDLVQRDSTGKLLWDYDADTPLYNKDKWIGLIFMHPGTSTIQYMMLKDIVENDLGFEFVEPGAAHGEKYVYQVAIAPAQMKTVFRDSNPFAVDGGIVWESYYSDIFEDHALNAKCVFLTGERSPDHTCCVVVANRTFTNNNSEYLIRFLAAYAETVRLMNAAITDPTSDGYATLLQAAHEYTGVSEDVLRAAFTRVEYTYNMDGLVKDVAELVDGFSAMDGVLQYTVQELGFRDSADFGDWLVDDYYLGRSEHFKPEDATTDITLKVTVLTGDLHGISLQFGLKLGIFEKYRINIEQSSVTNGPAAMDLLLSGTVNIGILGAPPTVIKSINMFK